MYITVIKYLAPVVLVVGYTVGVYKFGVSNEKTRWENTAYQATIESQKIAGKFTAGVLTDHKETQDDAQTKIEQLQNDLVDASTAANSLREQVGIYAKRAADSSRSAANCKATESAIGVLADMHAESDRLAGVYAKEADDNRIRLVSCAQSYADLKKRIEQK